MSSPSWEEMEGKRQEMIASFKEIAAAMKRCVTIIEDYTQLSPSSLPAPAKRSTSVPPTSEVKKRKRVSKPKDPNAPKRPASAYILFQNEVRDEVKKENPNLPYKEVMGFISQKWKDLTAEERQPYEGAYNEQIARYRTNEATYNQSRAAGDVPPPPINLQAAADMSSDSESDATSDTSDSGTPSIPAVPAVASKPKSTILQTPATIPPIQAPPSPLAATDGKKEKKRKNKEDEAAVAATLAPTGEKKACPYSAQQRLADDEQKKKKQKDATMA